MKEIPVFFSWAGVALVTLLPIINPVSTAVFLRSISSHLSREERNRRVTRACINMAAILVAFLLAAHLSMIAFGMVIPGMCIAGGMVIWRFEHLQQGPRFQKLGGK
jgi:multiple antibiotic resistance protein